MSGPERTPEYVEVGQNIATLEPTPHMRWHNSELQQWFEATSCTGHGVTHVVGKWRPVSHS